VEQSRDLQAERRIRDAQTRIDEQKARLHRLIVQGHPTQSADDILSAMHAELRKLQQLRLQRSL
jgi:hypothetical protein